MKNALILHGTSSSSKGNWFPWLTRELEGRGWRVWAPDLPGADAPNIKRYNDFIFSSDWVFNEESVLIGHSSGAVAILGIFQALPEKTVVDRVVLVGAFKDDLGRDDLKGLFEEPFDFEKIRSHARRFVFVHSDNDPFCPLPGAQYLAEKLGGELVMVPGAFHFSIGTGGERFKELPQVLNILDEKGS